MNQNLFRLVIDKQSQWTSYRYACQTMQRHHLLLCVNILQLSSWVCCLIMNVLCMKQVSAVLDFITAWLKYLLTYCH